MFGARLPVWALLAAAASKFASIATLQALRRPARRERAPAPLRVRRKPTGSHKQNRRRQMRER